MSRVEGRGGTRTIDSTILIQSGGSGDEVRGDEVK
jgi:hypothetical protein